MEKRKRPYDEEVKVGLDGEVDPHEPSGGVPPLTVNHHYNSQYAWYASHATSLT